MKKLFFSVLAVSLLASCGGSNGNIETIDGEVTSSVASNMETEAQLEKRVKEYKEQEEKRIKEEEESRTSISFDRKLHDFGNVAQGSSNTTRFEVINTGERPLIVSDVSASCGCTLPVKPKGPIAPGESDIIEVTFKPKKGQKNEIQKSITVVANTEPKISTLKIRAFVEE